MYLNSQPLSLAYLHLMVENSEVGPAPCAPFATAPSAPFAPSAPPLSDVPAAMRKHSSMMSQNGPEHEISLVIDQIYHLPYSPNSDEIPVDIGSTGNQGCSKYKCINICCLGYFIIAMLCLVGIFNLVGYILREQSSNKEGTNQTLLVMPENQPGDAWDECGNQDSQWGCKDSCSCIQEPGNPYYWQCIPPGGVGNSCQ